MGKGDAGHSLKAYMIATGFRKAKQVEYRGVSSATKRDWHHLPWNVWQSVKTASDLPAIADHLERAHEPLVEAVDKLRQAAAAEMQRREDRWRPIGQALEQWLPSARQARCAAEDIPRIKAAEAWLKEASSNLRNQRFAPIADQAMDMSADRESRLRRDCPI